jgi:signal transduction histidine kinase
VLGLRIDQARRQAADGRSDRVESELAACADLVQTAFHEVRRAIADLRVPVGRGRRFFAMLRRYLADYHRDTGIRVEPVFCVSDELQLPPGAEVQLIRIIQEALTNVRRHARTDLAQVVVDCPAGGPLVVTVSDDGVGFRPEEAGSGFGLASMRERAELLGGTCSVRSEPGRGTRVTVVVPLGDGEAGDGGRRA